MRRKQFGRLDLAISDIGFGTWAIGGNSYGPVNDKDSIRALNVAFDSGINFFDTANIYGNGHSEYLLGIVFRKKRNRIILATKAGYTDYSQRLQDFSEAAIRESLICSLRRLNTDYVDIFFLHSPPREVMLSDQVLQALRQLQCDRLVKYIGASVRCVEDGIIALEQADYDAIQVKYNLLETGPKSRRLVEKARNKQIFLVCKAPLCYGFLGGKRSEYSKFGSDDHRHRLSQEQRAQWTADAEAYRFLIQCGRRTLPQAALEFCMVHQDIMVPIPGMKTANQVKENIGAINCPPLTEQELERISNLQKRFTSSQLCDKRSVR